MLMPHRLSKARLGRCLLCAKEVELRRLLQTIKEGVLWVETPKLFDQRILGMIGNFGSVELPIESVMVLNLLR